MKKIKFITFLGILLCSFFIFSNNSYASDEEIFAYEKIDLIYNENFYMSDFGRSNYVLIATFQVESDIFTDYKYKDNLEESVFLYLDFTDIMEQSDILHLYGLNAFTFFPLNAELAGNTLTFTVRMYANHFSYYYSKVKGISQTAFINNFESYLQGGLYEYLKLIVRVDARKEYDGPYEYEKVINFVYNINFSAYDINIGDDTVEMSFFVKDDTFIDYKFKDNIEENVFLLLDYYQHAQNPYASPPPIELYNSEIINGNELHATVSIPKDYFNYYIEEIVKTDEETFYNNFSPAVQYDLYRYFKLYVRLDEIEYTYIKFTEYNATDIYLKETGPITSLFDLYIYINTDYKLENDITLTFRQDVDYDLHRGLDLTYNSYEILDFRFHMGYYRWRIHLNIALLNSLLDEYDNDANYIIENLMEIYIATKITPSNDYTNGYNAGYRDGLADGEQFGWHDGYNIGYYEGYDEGYFEGVKDSYSQGYEAGYEAGLQASQGEAYDLGYRDGYNKSFIATMDKWLVPAIVLVMFIGGFFAIARKKRDGDI